MQQNSRISNYTKIFGNCKILIDRLKNTCSKSTFQSNEQFDCKLKAFEQCINELTQLIPKPKIKILSDEHDSVSQINSRIVVNIVQKNENFSCDEVTEKIINYGKLHNFKYIPLSNPIVTDKDAICILCQRYSSRELGPLLQMKTYRQSPTFIIMHEQCALWTNNLYFFEQDNLKGNKSKEPDNIWNIINNMNNQVCQLCRKKGASLQCKKCNKKFHFPCFMNEYQYGRIISDEFAIICQDHLKKKNKQEKKAIKQSKQSRKNNQMMKNISNSIPNLQNQIIEKNDLTDQSLSNQEKEKRSKVDNNTQWNPVYEYQSEQQQILRQFAEKYLHPYQSSIMSTNSNTNQNSTGRKTIVIRMSSNEQ